MAAKQLKSNDKVCLYLGSAFLGVSREILDVLSTYRDEYKADVVHLGPLATDEEVKMWTYRTRKLATWEKQFREFAESISLSAEESSEYVNEAYDQLLEKGSKNIRAVNWDDVAEDGLDEESVKHLSVLLQAKIIIEKVRAELSQLRAAQALRVETLRSTFPDIGFLFSKENVVDPEATITSLGSSYLGTEIRHRHIHATSMLANGPRVSHAPITARTIASVAHTRKSTIFAHPTPMSDSRAAEGLNNARNFFTSGSLVPAIDGIKSTKDLYKAKHLPGAIVCVHAEDGSFFANNLIVDRANSEHFIGEDGLVFFSSGIVDDSKLKSIQQAVTLNDIHAPFEHHGVVNAAIYCAKAMKASTFILNGDVIENEGANRHAQGLPGEMEGKRIINDLRAGKRLVDKIASQSGCTELVWILGNHEMWLTQMVAKYPQLKGMIDWLTLHEQWFSDWRMIHREAGGNEVYRLGNLAYRHGDEESLTQAIEALGHTQQAHWHRYYRIGQSGILAAACRLGPAYIGNQLTAWQSQFSTHTVYEGLTQTSYHTVLHDEKTKTSRFVYRNKIQTVNWAA